MSSLLLLAGGFAAQHNRVPLSSDLCGMLFVAAIALLTVRKLRGVAIGLLGFVLFVVAGNQVIDARLKPRFSGDSMLVQVRVADFPQRRGMSTTMLLEPVGDLRLPPRSRVSWFEPEQTPVFGDVWELELRLRAPRGSSNPGGFRVENWFFRQKLHASGYVVAGPRNRRLESGQLSRLDAVRHRLARSLQAAGGESAAVLAAIGLGSRHLLSREQWERYAKTGTSHLMAISGLHIGLAAAAAFATAALVSGILRIPGNHLQRAILAGLSVAAAYALISGFAVPSRRAILMLTLVTVAYLCRRRPDPVRIIALAATLVFVADPLASMAPGFSLSFAAVIVLLRYAQNYRCRPANSPLSRCIAGTRGLMAMQVALLFGLMPLTVPMFQRVTLLAPAVNLIVVPVFSLVTVPLTLLGMVFTTIWEPIGAALLRFSALSISVTESVIAWFAALPVADTSVAGSGRSGLIVLLPALWVLLPRGWPGRSVALLAALAVFLHQPARPGSGCIEMHVLDVGQGLSVVLETRQRTLLFDTGASYRGGGSTAAQAIAPFLRYRGIDTIDWLVVSHADNDHAGGVGAIRARFDTGRIYVGERLPGKSMPTIECADGQQWRADDVLFRFLHPGPGAVRNGNDSSCVLEVSVGEHSVLLTGDIEAAAERRLLVQRRIAATDIVVIPHHGSLSSSSPAFVNRLGPNLAIASAAYANRWGFPRDRVTRRWEAAGAQVLDTGTSGAVSLQLCRDDGIGRLREQRKLQQRFWHDRPAFR